MQTEKKLRFDRKQIQLEQRDGTAMSSLARMQRRFIKQPDVTFQFLSAKLDQPKEMECYGYQLIDKKYY